MLLACSNRLCTTSDATSAGDDQIERELKLAGFDPGQVEQILDEVAQRVAVGANAFDSLSLSSIEPGPGQQVRVAEHRRQRRSELVAHVAQEDALLLVRLVRGAFRSSETIDGPVQLAHQHVHGVGQGVDLVVSGGHGCPALELAGRHVFEGLQKLLEPATLRLATTLSQALLLQPRHRRRARR